ncbi:retrotransposable element Tf2 [Tanacetum coccineum]
MKELGRRSAKRSLIDHSYKGNKYIWNDHILKRNGKIVVGSNEELRKQLITYFYNEEIRGHSGIHVTTKKLSEVFYWKGLKKIVKQLFRERDACQRQKLDLIAYPGLTDPLPISGKVCASQAAQVFLDSVYKLHGLPESIISDRDKVCLLPNTPIHVPYVPGDSIVENVDRTLQIREEWTNRHVKEDTREVYVDLITRFPEFDAFLEDKKVFKRDGFDTS